MPYEYEVHGHSANTMGKQNLCDWLNEMGAKDWRLVCFNPDIDTPIIFERKIEINKNLRALQLGQEPEKETLDDQNETDEN